MSDSERLKALELEIERLREEREMLLKIVSQMRDSLNRMISRCVTTPSSSPSTARRIASPSFGRI